MSERTTEDFFLHGYEYADAVDEVRPTPCPSCAFINSPSTVRPPDVSVAQLSAWARKYDGFLCHSQCDDGKFRECASWHARFRSPS